MVEYRDIRDEWRPNPPQGQGRQRWTLYKDYANGEETEYRFKSCPFCDDAPVVKSEHYGDRMEAPRPRRYFVECVSIGHCVRVEAPTLAELEFKWNARSRQDQCIPGNIYATVNPFAAIVEQSPKIESFSTAPSAERIYQGRRDILMPASSKFLYVDGDYNGGYYILIGNEYERDCLATWNRRLGVYPHFEPSAKKKMKLFQSF